MKALISTIRSNNLNGFSLLELLVVLSIFAVLSVIGTAMVLPTQKHKIDQFAGTVGSFLYDARLNAVRHGFPISVSIDDQAIFSDLAPSPIRIPDEVSLSSSFAREATPNNAVAVIWLYPDGSSTGGTIQIRSGKDIATITIDWFTGWISDDR